MDVDQILKKCMEKINTTDTKADPRYIENLKMGLRIFIRWYRPYIRDIN